MTYQTVAVACLEYFQMTLSKVTLRNYLQDAGISYHRVLMKGPDCSVPISDVYSSMLVFLKELRAEEVLETEPRYVVCMDNYFNSHRGELKYSLSPKGNIFGKKS